MSAPERTSARTWLRPILIFSIFVLFFYRFLNHSIIGADSFRLYAPYKFLIAAALGQGKVYGWNPWEFLGMPFVADILAGWFYPLNVIYLLLPFEPAHRLFILVHYPLAAIFMDLFLRRLGFSRQASLIAALAFPMSGYMVSMHGNMTFLIGPTWTPLALYFFERARKGPLIFAALSGAGLAMQVFGGDPQSAAVTALFIAVFAVAASLARPRRFYPLTALAVTGISAFALSAVQLFPTYEFMQHSVRRAGIDLEESQIFSFHPGRLIEFIWPTPFGSFWPDFTFWANFAVDGIKNPSPWSITNYMGLSVIALCFAGMFFSPRQWKALPALGLLFFLGLSVGHYSPLFGFIHEHVPLVGLFRYTSKYTAWATFCAVLLAALGAEELIKLINERKPELFKVAAIYILAVVTLAAASVYIWPRVLSYVTGPEINVAEYQDRLRLLIKGGQQVVVINLMIGAVLICLGRGYLSASRGIILLLCCLVVDLWLGNATTMYEGPRNIFDFRPAVAKSISPEGRPALGRYRVLRKNMNFEDTNPALADYHLYSRRTVWEYATMIRNIDTMEGFEDVLGYNAAKLNLGYDLLMDNLGSDMAARLNVQYIYHPLARKPIEVPHQVILRDPVNDVVVVKLDKVMPRAYWASAAVSAQNEKQALKLIMSWDYRDKVILTTQKKIPDQGSQKGTMKQVKITQYEPDKVIVNTDADAPGWLVLSDRFYPGWKAYLDGKPAAIFIANVLCRAVQVPAGKHQVTFAFESRPLRLGAAVSIPAWISLAGWYGMTMRKNRKKKGAAKRRS